MNTCRRWLRQPQSQWLRRAVFQVHLWTGLALGLYVAMLSLTGSALVYRLELNRMLATPTPAFEPDRTPLSGEQLAEAARRTYPGYTVTRVGTRIRRHMPSIEIWLEGDGERKERLFNPYTGEDLGDAMPRAVQALNGLALLHNDLLLGPTGRTINGIGSTLVMLLALTGAIVWWPGTRNWAGGLRVRWGGNPKRFIWDLHSALGFWFLALILIWAVSRIYLAFPDPVGLMVDYLSDPEAALGERPGDIVLEWMTRLHFGRFSASLQIVWVIVGLVPAAMSVTGGLMGWNRRFHRPSVASSPP